MPHDSSSPTAVDIWPMWAELTTENHHIPTIPSGKIWDILNPSYINGLKNQLSTLLEELGERIPVDVDHTISFDTSNGIIHIAEGALISPGTRFEGPCFIAEGVEIRHGAYVRAWSWACKDSVIGHASEIKHSLLLPGSKAAHFNYVGDAILGFGVNLGAGCKLANLRHDGLEVNVRHRNTKTPSGIRKFGALLGDGCQLGCNTVTNPGTILGINSYTNPNSTIIGIHPANSRHE